MRPARHLGADRRVEPLCAVGVVEDIDDPLGVDTVELVESRALDGCGRRKSAENGIVGPAGAQRLPVGVSPRKRRVRLLVCCGDVLRHKARPADPELCQQFGIEGVRKRPDKGLPPR